MHDSVHALARRAAEDPHFLASALAAYAAAHQLDETGLMTALGATPDTLAHARLCPMPAADAGRFKAEVAHIAGKFGLNRDVLTAATRLGQVALKMSADPEAENAAALLAARDRDQP